MATVEDVKLKVSVDGLQNLDKVKEKTDKAKESVNNFATAILGISFVGLISGALQAADRIADFSQATNISIASLKALENAMNQAGGSGKNLEKSVNTLYAAIETANGGSLAAREAFSKVGVSLNDLKTLSETDILQKTLEGLATMPPGAERAAAATQLLGRSFRGIDPKQLLEALDPGKYRDAEEATKKAAEAQQRLENAFKTLQEGAVKAIQPIIDLMGSKELTSDTAAKMITGLGIAMGITFGAAAVANIISIVAAVVKLSQALRATAIAQATLQAFSGPKGWAVLAGSLALLGGTIYGINALLDETDEKGKKAVDEIDAAARAAKQVAEQQPKTPGKITEAAPLAGGAKRKQELDAVQRAALESNRRIQQLSADTTKMLALQGADERQKIEIETATEIEKARIEIFSKENLSREQKAKEYAAKVKEISAKAVLDLSKIEQDERNTIQQQRIGYQDQVKQLLGQEKSELEKVNDLIAQQPDKYKNVGDQMRANAAEQDRQIKFIREFNSEQERQKRLAEEAFRASTSFAAKQLGNLTDTVRAQQLSNATSGKQKIRINEIADMTKRLNQFQSEKLTQDVIDADEADKSMVASKKQLDLLKDYADAISRNTQIERTATEERIRQAEIVYEIQRGFTAGWNDAWANYIDNITNVAEQTRTYFDTFTRGFENIFVGMMRGFPGIKQAFRGLIEDMIAQFLRLQAQKAFLALFGGEKESGILMNLFKFAVGGRAAGGPVNANTPYIVGERGPELLVPRSAGSIIPNNQLAMAGMGPSITNVNYTIQAVDASSFRTLVARDPAFIYAVTERGRQSQPTRRVG